MGQSRCQDHSFLLSHLFGQLPKAGLQAGSLAPKSHSLSVTRASQVALVVKNLPANAGDIRDVGLILRLEGDIRDVRLIIRLEDPLEA